MKKELSPKVTISIIAVLLLVVVAFAYQTFTAPSAPVKQSSTGGKPVGPRGGNSGGPTEADLQRMRDYNATHPGAVSSYR